MKKQIAFLVLTLFFAGCAKDMHSETPGRGTEVVKGPVTRVHPSQGPAREDRHGLWGGYNQDQLVWQLRYTRGVPTGPYREWNDHGDLIATWPYNWDGEIDGWARWFENGEPVFKIQLDPSQYPPFDPIGHAGDFRKWAETQNTE